MTKRIGLLTSGGDCAGLNAALRSVTLHATQTYGWEVYGIHQGTAGLLEDPIGYRKLTASDFDGRVLRQGGTILGSTNRGNPFAYPQPDGSVVDRTQEIISNYHKLGLDGLIGIGGDGSLAILRRIAQRGEIPLIGIPKTIDNDISMTENAIGFQTAVHVATGALDNLQPTAASHDRVMVLELMGRDAGHIALHSGISGGADVILIPEIPFSFEHIFNKINSVKKNGRNFALVVVAEAVQREDGSPVMIEDTKGSQRYGGIGHYVAEKIEESTGAQTRHMILGHLQRGGEPIAQDRVMGSVFGVKAVDLLAEGKEDRMVAWQNRRVVDVPLNEAIATNHMVDPKGVFVETARALGVCFGDQ